MSCSQPFTMQLRKSEYSRLSIPYPVYQIPCGWCLNCRKDRQNYFADRAKYELCTRLTGSFVTFTYDDPHLLTECVPDLPDTLPNGMPYTTLRYDHLTKFIDNIRHYVKNHKEIQNVLCQPDFSYMYVGEYGDVFRDHRPHFHVLFFGLDFAYCKKFIFNSWKKGFIDVLPILNGGIEYVTKYMDKQLHGDLAKIEYDNRGLARPRLHCSARFGQGLLWSKLDDIKAHNYTYQVGRIRRPISQYWKGLIGAKNLHQSTYNPFVARSQVVAKMKTYRLKDFTKKHRDAFALRQAQTREYNLRESLRRSGIPALDVSLYISNRFGVPTIDTEKVRSLALPTQQALSRAYVDNLIQQLEVS